VSTRVLSPHSEESVKIDEVMTTLTEILATEFPKLETKYILAGLMNMASRLAVVAELSEADYVDACKVMHETAVQGMKDRAKYKPN
jgi:hypothetical protein